MEMQRIKNRKSNTELHRTISIIAIFGFCFLLQFSFAKADTWQSLIDSSKFYQEKSDFPTAIKFAKLAMPIAEKEFGSLDTNYNSVVNNISYLFYLNGKLDSAIYYSEIRLSNSKKLFKIDHPYLANCINNVASFYNQRGDDTKAEPLYIEALEMKRRLFKTEHSDLALSINNMANFYNQRGNYTKSEPLYIEALDITRRLFKTDHFDLAQAINNIAIFYYHVGDYTKSEPLYIEALEMRRRLFKTDHPDLATSINNMATFYHKIGNYTKSEPLYIEALEMFRRLFKTDHPSLARSINNMALFYNDRGDFKKAEPLFIEALEIFRRLFKTDNPNLARSINHVAVFYKGRGDDTKAEPLYIEALEMYRRLFKTDHPSLARSINNMALFYNDRGDFKKAEPLFIEGLTVYTNMLNNYFPSLSEKEKKLFWNTVAGSFEGFNNYAVQRYAEKPSIASKMYDIQLYTKGLLFNSTSKVKNRILNSGDSSLILKYKQLSDKNEYLAKAYSMSADERTKKRINLDSLENVTNKLEKELSLKSEFFAQSADKKKVNWRSIQALLKPDEAAVEVVRFRYKDKDRFTDTICYAFLIVTDQTEENPELVLITDGNMLEEAYYKDYRMNVKNKFSDNKSFDRFWGKLYNKLKGFKKIYFSADGVYNKLNPSTLMKTDGKYLLEEQDIQQINSTKDILLNYYQAKQESNILNSAVLIGNPNFSLPEDKVTEVSRKMRGQKNEQDLAFSNLERSSDATRAKRDIDLSSLPGTEKEIKDIEKFLKNKKWEVSTFTGDLAIKGAVKTAVSPRVLHIATHGMFLADIKKEDKETFGFETQKLIENPLLRSGLFFTGANSLKGSSDNEENGLLTAYEAMNLNLDKTELVVLSACETGLGETRNGEGVFGLRRAFQQAGAKTIIMSLWSVSDDATQELMSKFYSYWVSGISKRDSFNKAQQDIKLKYKDPYYWGAFVMVGE